MDLHNSKMTGTGSVTPQRIPLLQSRSRYPSGIISPPFDPLSMDPNVIQYYHGGGIRSPTADVFASPTMDFDKYRQMLNLSPSSRGSSSSPLKSIENLQTPPPKSPSMFSSTPVKVEEDVIVMDGILVNKASPANRGRSSPLFDSGSSAGSNSGFSKTEICRFWEELGSCRQGVMCQFAHGKEELRPIRPTYRRNKTEVQGPVCKTFATTGACTYGTRCRFVHQSASARALTHNKVEEQSISHDWDTPSNITSDWSPMDDGIEVHKQDSAKGFMHAYFNRRLYDGSEVCQPGLTRESVDAYINDVLYGQARPVKRLPVFKTWMYLRSKKETSTIELIPK